MNNLLDSTSTPSNRIDALIIEADYRIDPGAVRGVYLLFDQSTLPIFQPGEYMEIYDFFYEWDDPAYRSPIVRWDDSIPPPPGSSFLDVGHPVYISYNYSSPFDLDLISVDYVFKYWKCGNGICDLDENACNCGIDCGYCSCGNGICEPSLGESCSNCFQDCSSYFDPITLQTIQSCVCGDGLCDVDNGEDAYFCPLDCGSPQTCGNGICDGFNDQFEDCQNCPQDCGSCTEQCAYDNSGQCCQPGYYGNNGRQPCEPCGPGTGSDQPGSTICSPCGVGYYSDFNDNGGLQCVKCPDGSTTQYSKSFTIEQCFPLPGYWRSDSDPNTFLKCNPAISCPGGKDLNKCPTSNSFGPDCDNQCSQGYDGRICGECAAPNTPAGGSQGYYKLGNSCSECPQNSNVLTIFIGIAAIFGLFGVFKIAKKLGRNVGSLTISFSFAQTLSLFPRYKLVWPSTLLSAFEISSLFSINIEVTNPECVNESMRSYASRWRLIIFTPIIVGLIILSFYLVVIFRNLWVRCAGSWLRKISKRVRDIDLKVAAKHSTLDYSDTVEIRHQNLESLKSVDIDGETSNPKESSSSSELVDPRPSIATISKSSEISSVSNSTKEPQLTSRSKLSKADKKRIAEEERLAEIARLKSIEDGTKLTFGEKILFWLAVPCPKEQMSDIRSSCINSYVLFLSTTYIVLASTVLEVFACTKQNDGTLTLDAKPSIRCYEDTEHTDVVGMASIFIFLYVIGIPVTIFACLFRYRHRLSTVRKSLGFLFQRYEEQYYFWEVVILIRKLALVCVSLFLISDPLQGAIFSLGVLLLSLVFQSAAAPFLFEHNDVLEFIMLFNNFLVLFSGIIFLTLSQLNQTDSIALEIYSTLESSIMILLIASGGLCVLALGKDFLLAKAGLSKKRISILKEELKSEYLDEYIISNFHSAFLDWVNDSFDIIQMKKFFADLSKFEEEYDPDQLEEIA